jgi:hypothetical protein
MIDKKDKPILIFMIGMFIILIACIIANRIAINRSEDRWTYTDMKGWVSDLQNKNPKVNVPISIKTNNETR